MDLFTYLMAKNGHNTSIHEDLFSYLLGKAQGGGGEIKTATGVTINIPDAKKLVNFMMTKESTQYTTTGINLLPNIQTQTLNGITITNNGDGSYTLNGTASTNTYFDFFAGTFDSTADVGYYLKEYNWDNVKNYFGTSSSNPITYRISASNRVGVQSLTYADNGQIQIEDNGTDLYLAIRINNGGALLNVVLKPMLVASSSSLSAEVEAYTGGQPSPSPDFPQEVKTVKEYRNLFDKDNVTIINAYLTDGFSWASASDSRSFRFAIEPNKTYCISCNNPNEGIFRAALTTSENIPTQGNPVSIHDQVRYTNTNTPIVLTTNNTDKYIVIQFGRSQIETSIQTLQIVEGNQELPYVPYGNNYIAVNVNDGNTTNSYPIPLNNNEIVGIGDYKDELLVDKSGNVFINKKTGKVTFNGTESWVYSSASSPYFRVYIVINDKKSSTTLNSQYTQMKSNLFKGGRWSGGTAQGESTIENADQPKRIFIIINQSRLSDYSTQDKVVQSFKTWLSTHNTEVYYALETPTLIDLQTTVDLKLFKGANNVSNSEDGYMTIEYVSENNET